MELYKKYRPKNFGSIVGQKPVVKMLEGMVKKQKVPHALLFTGPSGCGKTTLARILRRELRCNQNDFHEVNCADFRGIDTIRSFRTRMLHAPLKGKCCIWLIDECHKLSNDAQNALLKMLEDTPKHVWFMLATTDPKGLIGTIRTRCTEITVKNLADDTLSGLINTVAKAEKVKISEEVVEKIIECSEGSARKALVLLNQIIDLESEDEQLEAVENAVGKQAAFAIAQTLHKLNTNWGAMAKVLREVEISDPEAIRYQVMGYAKAILIKGIGGKIAVRAYTVIDAFADNFYYSKVPGLVAACYEVINSED